MAFVARNGIWLSKSTPSDTQLVQSGRSSGFIEAIASGSLRLASLSSNISIDAGGASAVLTVASNAVVVRGGLDVLGAINAIETNDLQVRDRLVCLANYDDLPASSRLDATSGAGILVGSRQSDGTAAEVSVRWNKTQSQQQQQSTWDVLGGALRLKRFMPSGACVAYRFSINDAAELEVLREVSGPAPAATTTVQRVASWGRPATGSTSSTSSSSGLSLPTSANPY